MTKTQKSIITDLASICTKLQNERTEFTHIAYALWKLSEGKDRDAEQATDYIFDAYKIAH